MFSKKLNLKIFLVNYRNEVILYVKMISKNRIKFYHLLSRKSRLNIYCQKILKVKLI